VLNVGMVADRPQEPREATSIGCCLRHDSNCSWHSFVYVCPSVPHTASSTYARSHNKQRYKQCRHMGPQLGPVSHCSLCWRQCITYHVVLGLFTPSFRRYQVGDRGTRVWTTCPRLLLDSVRGGRDSNAHVTTVRENVYNNWKNVKVMFFWNLKKT